MTDIPEGFEHHPRRSPLTEPWQPLYSRRVGNVLQIGVRLREAHCNARGLAHGGLIAALADNAMGLSSMIAHEAQFGVLPAPAITIGLSLDFVSSAKAGQWLQVEPRVIRCGKSMAFIDALVTADADTVSRANATFRLG